MDNAKSRSGKLDLTVGGVAAKSALAICISVIMGVAAGNVQAATLTNLDKTAYTIDVMAKSVSRQHSVAPGKSLADFCADGCVIRLNGSADADYALEGTERVSIEGGLIYYDGEEVSKDKTNAKSGNNDATDIAR